MATKVHVGMETEMNGNGRNGVPEMVKNNWKKRLLDFSGKMKRFTGCLWRTIWKAGREDPRRIIHAFKVGLCLTLVSLLYLIEPLFKSFGTSAIWAVMTVVVVLEFTAGATLCKGLNRGLGTVLAGSLAFLINYIATRSESVVRAVFIGAAVFLICVNEYFNDPEIKENQDKSSEDPIYKGYKAVLDSKSIDETLALYASWEPRHSRHCYRFPWQQYVKVGAVLRQFGYTVVALHGCLQTEIQLDFNGNWEIFLFNSNLSRLVSCSTGTAATYMRFFPYIKKNYDYGVVIFLLTFNLITVSSYRVENVLKIVHDRFYAISIGCAICLFMSLLVFPIWSGEDLHNSTVGKLEGLAKSIETPRSVRARFKDPCIRLAGEVTKALMELANNIRRRRHCSPEILSDHLHEALQDLDTAIKSQPRLFLGSKKNQTTSNMLALAAAHAARYKQDHGVSLASVKTDSSAFLEWKRKRVGREEAKENERKALRPQLSKIAITSLEFSEALPFAAFASLLVEIVARLDHVIEEVEELGRIACYKEFNPDDDDISVTCRKRGNRVHVSTKSGYLPTKRVPEEALCPCFSNGQKFDCWGPNGDVRGDATEQSQNRRLPITTAIMGTVSLSNFTSLSGPAIYIPTYNKFQWTPYEDPAIRAVIPDELFQNPNVWHVKVPLVNYAIVEMHQLDRVLQ
ncbi:hypothetical protein GOBAR_AA17798 [Gossypium barbadense]|uniref:Aluminum-activated malate transporter n=1 Tax=Gossypium barbadense TaxID=3634 RepID=A0A2P5XHN2_GOSBA|nr:hypothetical protein GOBAR_AA17798 [Gossypium barbadense]